jgi:hypothetical protein
VVVKIDMVKSESVYDEKRKGKIVNYFINVEMAERLDRILALESPQTGIKSRNELIRRVLSNFINAYFGEQDKFTKALSKSSEIDNFGKLTK